MMRRGFTVLEITLAIVMGMIVLTTALSLMASMDRTDARLEVRHEQRMELSRARKTLQRAMTSLVMDDSPQNQDEDNLPPSRIRLEQSDSPGAVRLFNRARLLGIDLGEPQRFEVVVKHPPTPVHSILSVVLVTDDDVESASLDQTGGGGLTHRGAFELWPDNTRPGSRQAELAWQNTSGMTLWWIPTLDDDADVVPDGEIPGAVPLVSGLISCKWQVLRDQERRTAYDAIYVVDLPGFVEFEARTNAGIHVNWMFEIMWTEGPEVGQDELQGEEDGLDGDDAAVAGGSGASGAGGAADNGQVREMGVPSAGGRSRSGSSGGSR